MELLTATAKRVKVQTGHWKGFFQTEYTLPNGQVATVDAAYRQPRRDKKTVTINCCTYKVIWP